jgi:hypothetical protein
MDSKKLLITIVVIIVILIVGGLLWKGGFLGRIVGIAPVSNLPTGGITTTPQTGAGGQTGGQTAGGDIGKMTDEIYIEIAAQAAYYSQKDPANWSARLEALYKKYGVTEESMTAYSEALSKDPQHAAEFAQKYAQRLTELQNTGK